MLLLKKMQYVFADSEEECWEKLKKNDIVILKNSRLLFGWLIFTSTKRAMEAVYETHEWKEAQLGNISAFAFFIATKEEMEVMVKRIVEDYKCS